MNKKIIITESDRSHIRKLYQTPKSCCKSKINEGEENCYSPESTQGLQLINTIAAEIKGLGISPQDIQMGQETPEVIDAKTKVAQMLNPVLPNATKSELKSMIQDLKAMRRQKRQNKQQPTPQEQQPSQVNEQAGALAAWESVKVFLLGLPAGVFIAIGAWLILRLLRCHIYEGLGRISVSCGLDIQRSFLVKLAELVFLDFKNLFETDPVLWNCK
jgi:hypothetical protein